MNFTESFDQFSSKATTTDLALYAGIGMVLWVLFKDKLSPVQKMLMDFVEGLKSRPQQQYQPPVQVQVPVPAPVQTQTPAPQLQIPMPDVTQVVVPKQVQKQQEDDNFLKLVLSWKQTRDLASKLECKKAVEVVDQMFPYLSPEVCNSKADGEASNE